MVLERWDMAVHNLTHQHTRNTWLRTSGSGGDGWNEICIITGSTVSLAHALEAADWQDLGV